MLAWSLQPVDARLLQPEDGQRYTIPWIHRTHFESPVVTAKTRLKQPNLFHRLKQPHSMYALT